MSNSIPESERAFMSAELGKLLREQEITVSVTLPRGSLEPVIRTTMIDSDIRTLLLPVVMSIGLKTAFVDMFPLLAPESIHGSIDEYTEIIRQDLHNASDRYLAEAGKKEADDGKTD